MENPYWLIILLPMSLMWLPDIIQAFKGEDQLKDIARLEEKMDRIIELLEKEGG